MLDFSILRSLVWTDYRLAVLFSVLAPLALLLWAVVRRSDAIQQLLTIYWKVASLLAITVYLMIGGFSISFIAALIAHTLIPLSLWFWADLNEEIREQPNSPLKLAFSAWRWAMTVFGGVNIVIQLFFLRCAFSGSAFSSTACQTWLEAPRLYRDYFHGRTTSGFLGFFGIVGLVIYMACLGYFVLVKLGRQGRSATNL